MDRTLKNKEALQQVLADLSKGSNSDMVNARTQLFVDEEQQAYILFFTGWLDRRYIHNLMFHFQLKEDKIWIYENNTDCLVHEALMDLEVEEEDIVFAWEAFPVIEDAEATLTL